MKYTIAKFLYFGEDCDFSNEGYEVDTFHRVFKNGARITSKGFRVRLKHADGTDKYFNAIRLFQAVVHPLPPDIEKDAKILTIDASMHVRDARRYEYETQEDRVNLVARRKQELSTCGHIWEMARYPGNKFFENYEINKKTGVVREKLTQKIVESHDGIVDLPVPVSLPHRVGSFPRPFLPIPMSLVYLSTFDPR